MPVLGLSTFFAILVKFNVKYCLVLGKKKQLMHQNIFAELSLVIALAAGISMIMRLIRQPLIIGHILTGIIVGPSVLHLVKSPETIEIFASIGIALLLFIIGLGLNPKVIKEVGKVSAITGVIQVLFIAGVGGLAGIVLGFGKTESVFFGLALAFSSTIIILKLLSDKKEQSRLYGKVVIGLLLIQDIIAVLSLLLVTSKSNGGFSPSQLGILLAKGTLITIPVVFIGNIVLPKMHKLIAGSPEFLFLFALGWGFGIAALFEQAGFSLEIGALLAGVSLASLPYAQEISARLRPLRDFFIVVFFITLGTQLTFGHIALLLPAIIMGSFIVIILKPIIVLAIMGLLGYTKRTSFKAAISTAQVSEFSLVLLLLGNSQGMVSQNLVVIITIIALISIACSAYLIIYSDSLYKLADKYFTLFERRKTHFEQDGRHRYDLVLFGYRKGGHEFLKTFQSLGKPFVVVDYDPEVIDMLEHLKVNFLYGDAGDIELLDEIGLERSKLVVSTITDYSTTSVLLPLILSRNPGLVVICHAESKQQADQLYDLGASYVMMPHFLGSKKISDFIKHSGIKKSEFKKFREQHLAYLHSRSNANIEE